MRMVRVVLLWAALGAAGAWAPACAQTVGGGGAGGAPRVVVTDREAFLLLPDEVAVGPHVQQVKSHPGGRYTIAVRQRMEMPKNPSVLGAPPAGDVSVVVWDSRTRRAAVAWKSPLNAGAQAAVESVEWLPGSDLALAWAQVVSQPPGKTVSVRRTLLLLDASRGSARPIPAAVPDTDTYERLLVSPGQPLAVLHALPQNTLRVVRANGTVSAPVSVPNNVQVSGDWSENGELLYLAEIALASPVGTGAGLAGRDAPEAGPEVAPPVAPAAGPARRWYALNARTGAIGPVPKPTVVSSRPSQQPPAGGAVAAAATLPLRLKAGAGTLTEAGTTQALRPLWLESVAPSDEPRALLAPDGHGETLVPDGSGALYQSGGALHVVPFLRIDKATFLAARREAQQAVAMSNAKQIGLACMMYAQDYDERYPPAEDIVNVLQPYTKNLQIFNNPATNRLGFTYLLPGGTEMAAIESPADTPLGYVLGPGGRAIVFADGHVTWKDD